MERCIVDVMEKSIPAFRLMTVLFVLLQFLLISSSSVSEDETSRCEELPYVVRIHADWCSSCRATENTWNRVRTELASKATVLNLDVTDRVAYNESVSEVERLGLEEFFQQYRRQTGVVVVLDCRTREPVRTLTGERDFEKYLQAVEEATRTS